MLLTSSRSWFARPLGKAQAAHDGEPSDMVRFERLVDAHLDAIYRTARRLGVRNDDVADVVQEVLIVVARRMSDIDVNKERAFALGTTARMAANFRRKAQRRRETLVGEVMVGAEPSELASAMPQSGEGRVRQAEALALLRSGLDAMTEAQRETFVLFELEELRASEIAAELGIAESAVTSRLNRARQVMRRACRRVAAESAQGCIAHESEILP